jgi:hypothetical protein
MPFVSMQSKCRQLPNQMLLSSLSHGGNARRSRAQNNFLRDRLKRSHSGHTGLGGERLDSSFSGQLAEADICSA